MRISYNVTNMYEKALNHQPRLTTNDDELTARELAYGRRSVERPRRIARRTIATIGSLVLGPALILQTDIAWHESQLLDTEPVIHSIAEPLESEDAGSATVFIDGFAGQDGSWIAGKMTEALQAVHDSNVWALEYDRAGINISDIAEKIATKASEEGVDTISLYGYSIGGIISTEVANFLQEKYHITVDVIFLDHTPSGAGSIRPKIRNQGIIATSIIRSFKDIGINIEYSGIARAAVEATLLNNVSYLQDSTTSLMRDQFLIGVSANSEHNISKLKTDEHPEPVIVYITSADPETDYMVDDAKSEKEFKKFAKKAGLPYIVLPVDGAIHSRPDLTLPACKEALSAGHDEVAAAQDQMFGSFLLSSGTLVRYRVKNP